jgi:hypothetical protein
MRGTDHEQPTALRDSVTFKRLVQHLNAKVWITLRGVQAELAIVQFDNQVLHRRQLSRSHRRSISRSQPADKIKPDGRSLLFGKTAHVRGVAVRLDGV